MAERKQPCVYILANGKHGATYIGVTSNLAARLYQHRAEAIKGHSAKYEIKRLVWYEVHETKESAILREKRLKKWSRDWKIRLIEETNPDWVDLGISMGFEPVHRSR